MAIDTAGWRVCRECDGGWYPPFSHRDVRRRFPAFDPEKSYRPLWHACPDCLRRLNAIPHPDDPTFGWLVPIPEPETLPHE